MAKNMIIERRRQIFMQIHKRKFLNWEKSNLKIKPNSDHKSNHEQKKKKLLYTKMTTATPKDKEKKIVFCQPFTLYF